MIRYTLILSAMLLGACGPGEEENGADALLDALQEDLDALQAATDTYVTGVNAAADVTAVDALQTSYDVDVEHALEEMGHTLDDVAECSHMGDGASRVVDAKASLQAIREAVDALLAAHPAHTDVAECQAMAADHDQAVAAELDAMAEHHDAWGGMHCDMHHDDEPAHTD